MSRKKSFRFAKRRKLENIPIVRPVSKDSPEGLTGVVRGRSASDIEERFARSLDSLQIKFWFQYGVETNLSLPDQDRMVDFIVFHAGNVYPIEIYGERWHSTAGDMNLDRARQAEIDQVGDKFDWEDLQVIWGRDLRNQQMADAMARRMFI